MMNGGGSSPPSSSARLTPEQRAIIALVKPPGSVPAEGEMVRVTSGAGTGKTTTLEHLAARAVKLGHKQIVLLTYNKSAAADAGHKLGRHADCRTAHSAAFRCLGYNNKEEDADVIDDAQLSKKAVAMFSGEIEANMLRECVNLQGSRRSAVLKQIANFIVKTFVRFIQSDDSLSDGFNHKKSTNTYYPAQLVSTQAV
jgi:superfamily I DNA/RNA helicase